jgi:hypothetical protein
MLTCGRVSLACTESFGIIGEIKGGNDGEELLSMLGEKSLGEMVLSTKTRKNRRE